MIAIGLTMGISKAELLNDYYVEEIGEIIYEYNDIHSYKKYEADQVDEVDSVSFFGI